MAQFLAMLEALIAAAPHLVPSFVQLYGDAAHGEGGGAKVAKILTDAGTILTQGAAIAAPPTPPAA